MTNHDEPDDLNLPASYTLKTVLHLTGVQQETLVAYCEQGLLPVAAAELDSAEFDDHFIRLVRRIESLRAEHGINLAGIHLILELLNEIERMEHELKFRVDR